MAPFQRYFHFLCTCHFLYSKCYAFNTVVKTAADAADQLYDYVICAAKRVPLLSMSLAACSPLPA